MADLQNFDFKLVKQEVNSIYTQLINCESTKASYLNNGYRQKFVSSDGEKGDGKEFFVKKRKGFVKLPLYNYSGTNLVQETDVERLSGICYDVCIVKGVRYFLYYNNIETKLRIYKHINVKQGPAENTTDVKISSGNIVNISSYSGRDYFPADKNLDKKFMLNTYVRGKAYDFGIGSGKVILNKDKYYSIFYEEGKDISGSNGDYLRTDTGIVHIIGGETNGPKQTEGGFKLATSWSKVIEYSGDVNVKNNIEYKVFKEYGLTFHFVTSDGLVHWHYDEGTPSSFEYSFCGTLKFDTNFNTITQRFLINSLSVYNEGTILLNSLGALFVSGTGFDKFYYSGLNIIQTTGVYWSIREYMSNIILLGPHKIGYLIFDTNTNVSDLYELVNDGGTYGKNSFGIQDDQFMYVRNTNEFYKLELSYGYGAGKPQIKMGYLSGFLNTDLEGLQKNINEVTVSIVGNNNYILIGDGGHNTKILFYDRYYNTRYKRMVTGCSIKGIKHGCFMGDGIYENIGDNDNGNNITQIISSVFGDRTKNARKKIEYIKIVLGYNSYITPSDTIFNAYMYDGGYEYKIAYPINTPGGYVDNIMRLQYDSETFNPIEFELSNLPIGVTLNSCEGVNVDRQEDSITTEFESYNNLGIFTPKISFENTYNISKVGFIKFPIGQPCEIIAFEIVARGKDKVEMGGFFTSFQYYDNDFGRIEDSAHIVI